MALLGVIGILGFIVGIALMIVGVIKKKKYRGGWITLIAFILFVIAVSSSPESSKENAEKNSSISANVNEAKKSNIVGKSTVSALESNNFIKFVNEYKKLGSDKTSVWDTLLYGKKVTWTGTVEHAGPSEVFVYGLNDYNGELWAELSDKKKMFYCFVAKYENPSQFKELEPGDEITVQGILKSRGDYDLNYNWKIYDAVLVK